MNELAVPGWTCAACGGNRRRVVRYNQHLGWRLLRQPMEVVRWATRGGRSFARHALRFATGQAGLWRSPFRGYVSVCGRCGHGTMESPPDARTLSSYYRSRYWREGRRTAVASDFDDYKRDERAREQLMFVEPFLFGRPPRSGLEIGAGSAFALQLLRSRFPEAAVYACEPGELWTPYYETRRIVRIARIFPFEGARRFDYIHASHWLEHVVDVDRTVEDLESVLEDSGLVFVEVPNTGHAYWDLPVRDVPHVHFFSVDSLRRFFERAGFSCLQIGEFGPNLATYLRRGFRREFYESPAAGGCWIRALFQKASPR